MQAGSFLFSSPLFREKHKIRINDSKVVFVSDYTLLDRSYFSLCVS